MAGRFAAALLLALACAGSACAEGGEEGDARGRSVFDRTKQSRTIYSVYSWNWVRGTDGASLQGWSAEFHKGALHRVETPEMRVIADCAAGTGTAWFVRENRTETGPQFARSACGINSNPAKVTIEWAGRKDGRFGTLDTIRISDGEYERSYAVNPDGALLAAEYFAVDPQADCVQSEALAIDQRLPEGDIFSEESLSGSVVPDRYQQSPAAPNGEYWLGEFRCR